MAGVYTDPMQQARERLANAIRDGELIQTGVNWNGVKGNLLGCLTHRDLCPEREAEGLYGIPVAVSVGINTIVDLAPACLFEKVAKKLLEAMPDDPAKAAIVPWKLFRWICLSEESAASIHDEANNCFLHLLGDAIGLGWDSEGWNAIGQLADLAATSQLETPGAVELATAVGDAAREIQEGRETWIYDIVQGYGAVVEALENSPHRVGSTSADSEVMKLVDVALRLLEECS